jgi:hypothetical protein
MHATFDTAAQRITQAHADKEHFRCLWEGNRMYIEDLEASSKRLDILLKTACLGLNSRDKACKHTVGSLHDMDTMCKPRACKLGLVCELFMQACCKLDPRKIKEHFNQSLALKATGGSATTCRK